MNSQTIRKIAMGAFLIGCMLLHPPGNLRAQSTFGSIVGVVRDPTQAVLSGATVVLRSLDDNSTRTAKAASDGSFEFVNLKSGRYSVTAQAQGFADFLVSSAQLEARQTLRVDIALALKSESQTVEVSEEGAAALNTENAVLANSVSNKDITQLPLNSRAVSTSPLAALSLSANVQQDSQGNFALGGANASMVGFSVDGISTANVRQNGALQDAYPSIEGIAELKVTASNNNAEFAQVGDVTFTTKSGSNVLHGSLFEYLQNDALDADIYGFSQKAPKRFNTFGGSLGGPVSIPRFYRGRDRTFFFIDYEGNRKRTDTPMRYLVPSASERSGNLSDLPNPNGSLMDPTTNQPFPNNTIPLSRINRTAQALLNSYYPLPNLPNAINGYNYQTLQPIPSNTNGFDARLDQMINSKQQVYARFSWKNVQSDVANPLLPNDVDTEHNRSLLISHSYSITSKIVNEFRFGFTSTLVDVNFPISGASAISQLGLQGIDISQHAAAEAFPTFNFSDGTGFTPIGRDRPGITQSNTKQLTDNLTVIKGGHTFRFGADIRWVHYQDLMFFLPSDDFGDFTFNQGVFTGSSFGDFMLGMPNTSFFAITSPQVNARATQLGIYGQDEWRVNDRLTVSYGLRWELLPPFNEGIGDLGSFDPRTNSVLVPDSLAATLAGNPAYQAVYTGFLQSFNACTLAARNTALPCSNVKTASQAGLTQGLRQLYLRDLDPRIGIAYRPFRDNKTVIRAGFGIFTVTTLGPMSFNNAGNPLSVLHTYVNAGADGSPQFQFPQTSSPAQSIQYGGGSLDQANDPNFRDPQSAQWNVTLERELTQSIALRVSYVGMNSYRLTLTEDLNQIAPSATPYTTTAASPYVDPRAPYANWFTLLSTENAGFQNYQALEVSVTRKLSKGLSFQANYAWAKNLSDAQGDAPSGFASEVAYGLAVSNRFDLRGDRGNVEGTRRQRALLTGTYELPFGPGRRWNTSSHIASAVLGGWNLNTVTLIETGPWLTPTISASLDASNTDVLARATVLRPDLVGNPVPSNQNANDYFNINAFAPTPANAGRFGNAGVGILEGPGTVAVAGGLSKTVQLRERARLRFEATFTNLMNHPNFAPPATNISSPSTFGILSSVTTAESGGNRTGQLSLRLDF
jgi:hypothetical protein